MVALMERNRVNSERIYRDIMEISRIISPVESKYTRFSFSQEDRQARTYIAKLMEEEANLTVKIDAVGNLIGRREGKRQKPAILVGSHIDTVRGGGRFDGVAGVIAGIEIARKLEENGVQNIYPFEVVVFLAEEPSPFGISTIGSRGMTGKLSKELLNSLKNEQGTTLGDAIESMGGDPKRFREAVRTSDDVHAYLELHIEQGPTLFSQRIPIGIVTGISGILRAEITVIGRSDHAGTTPMKIRKDALIASSEIVLAHEKIFKGLDGVVSTIGKLEIFPNAPNVVPGRVTLWIDTRSLEKTLFDQTTSLMKKELEKIRKKRDVQINFEQKISSRPVMFNLKMIKKIERIFDRLEISYLSMQSGAGHDASHMAEIAPTGMIFVPSKDGRSHCQEEWSEIEHISFGTEGLACVIAEIDQEEVI